MRNNTFLINKEFKTRLTTAILSAPIVYIPHFNYSYIDKALTEIVESGLLGFSLEGIIENNNSDFIDFKTKSSVVAGNFLTLIQKLIKRDTFDKEYLFLCKNSYSLLADINIQSRLQTFAAKYEREEFDNRTTIILVSSQSMEELPPEVEKIITVVDVPRPDEIEIEQYIIDNLPISQQFKAKEEDLILSLTRTLQGLQQYEIEQIVKATKVRTGGYLTEQSIQYALDEKKAIVRKSGIIEVIDSNVSFEQVGGLENLCSDIRRKATLFKHLNELTELKLPLPKGILVLGMPGCGKSMVAKSIANEFGVSLLRLDINRLMGQYVGQSEGNLRKALATAEAAHPCVLWIDEIEKAFAGANSGGGGGNDIVMRLMGHFLTWMQERKTAVYIVATANDVMRPEFMRKGRFDEVYFVDFPSLEERIDILKKKLQLSDDQQKIFDISEVNTDDAIKLIASLMEGDGNKKDGSNGFSGSEIQSVVESVIEKKYVEYLNKCDIAKQKGETVGMMKMSIEDFEIEIDIIKPSIMANQKGLEEHGVKQKTSVERIRDLQKIYQFRNASK